MTAIDATLSVSVDAEKRVPEAYTLVISTQVWDLQPDVNHKHWPTGSPQEMARAARDAATVELQPGDALYVPLMWPHSVQSIDASVTSNKYLYLKEGWLDYIGRAKTAPWLVYEMERGGLC